jgi:formate hydrogenlyase subunit 3/multisubunit Na+/H+ antiporter MnhD subunit
MENKYAPGENPFIVIPAVIASIYLVIVIMFLIFAKDQLNYLESIAWAFAAMAIFAVIFAYNTQKKKRK